MTSVDQAGRSELHYAAASGDLDKVRSLIAAGESPALADARGMTPLHFAAQENQPAVARVLLDAGAPIDAQDEHGNTPLWKAVFACTGDGELIGLLRGAGADPLLVNRHGKAPVDLARLIANQPVAEYFADLPDRPAQSS